MTTALTAEDFSNVLTLFQSNMSSYIADIPVEDCWAYADGESQWTCYCPNCLEWQRKRSAGIYDDEDDDSLEPEGDVQDYSPLVESETLPICVDKKIHLFELPYEEPKPTDVCCIIDTDENFSNHLTDAHDQPIMTSTLLQSYMSDHPEAWWAGTVVGTKGRNCHIILQFNELAYKPSHNPFIKDLQKVIKMEHIDLFFRFDQVEVETPSKNRTQKLNKRYNQSYKSITQPERKLMFAYVDKQGYDPTLFSWDEATMTYFRTKLCGAKKVTGGFNVLKALPVSKYVCKACHVPFSAAFPGKYLDNQCPNQFCPEYNPLHKYGQHHKSGDLPVLAGFIRTLMSIDLVIREKPVKKRTLISERLLAQNRLRGLPDYFGTTTVIDH
jgi:hypothetical protein